jgi:lipopolysaccharide export system permease protein
VVAKKGRIVADEATKTISLLLGEGTAHELLDGRYSRTDFTSNSLSIDPTELKMENNKGVSARELYLPSLLSAIAAYRPLVLAPPSGGTVTVLGEELTRADLMKKYRRAKIELGQRFSLPIASLIMAFVGMALGITTPRTQRVWGAGFAAALGLAVFIAYYSIFSIGLALADSGKLKIWIALWLPNFVAGTVACLLVHKIGSEQWQSVSEGIQRILSKIVLRLRRA